MEQTTLVATENSQSNGGGLTLAHFDRARTALEAAASIDEVKNIRDQAEALRQYARQSRQSLEMQNRCAEIKLRAERKAGEMLAAAERGKTGPKELPASVAGNSSQRETPSVPVDAVSPYREALASIDLPERTAVRWQAVAAIPEPVFEAHVREVADSGEELTTAGLLRAAAVPHVAHNSGENEWYTPAPYIAAARLTMGSIDLDPASSAEANTVVLAETFYTQETDGLAQRWAGNVWMNPPYAAELVGRFIDRLIQFREVGEIRQACVLVNNATETRWFQALARSSAAICFPERRVRFWNTAGEASAPLQGQAILYVGHRVEEFKAAFGGFGVVVVRDG